MNPRSFHLGDILSVTTGCLVAPRHIDAVYDLLGFMTGEDLFTHQLPRVARECAPALLAQHPQLAAVVAPEEFDDEAHVGRWLAEQTDTYGTHLDVTPLNPADHTHINPFAEWKMMAPDVPIIPVVLGDES